MRKVFKKCVAIALAAAMAFGTNAVYTSSVANADVASGTATDEVVNPVTQKTIVGTGWWGGPNENSQDYNIAPNGSVDIYFQHVGGNTGLVLEGHAPGAVEEIYFDNNLQGTDSWGDLIASKVEKSTPTAIAANGSYKLTLTRNDQGDATVVNVKLVNADNPTEVLEDTDYTLAKKIEGNQAFYLMATDATVLVSPYEIVTKSEKIVGTGWWGGPNGVSSNYYVGPNEETQIIFQHLDGNTGVVFESNYWPAGAEGPTDYLDANLQVVADDNTWGTLIASKNDVAEGQPLKANGKYKATITRNDEGEATVVTVKIVNLDDETDVYFDKEFTLKSKLDVALPFYLLATDATLLVGPTVESMGQEVDMINTGKATISGSNINYTFKTTDVKYDTLTLEVNNEVVATASAIDVNDETGVASYQYPITKAGDYTFKATATKNADDTGFYKDDVLKTEIGVVECANKYYAKDATLAAAPTISESNGSYVVSWTAEEDVDYVLLVEDKDGKVVAPKSTSAGKATFTNLAEGTYTATLTAIDGKFANQETNQFSVQKAAEASATSKFAQITTKPIYSYEFNSATENGLKLTNASIKKVTVDGKSENVLQLGNTSDLTLQHKSYATIPSLSSKDFSNGLTVTFDVNVNGAYNADNINGWTKFFGFGNGVIGRDPVAGEFAYGYTLGLNHVVDNNDWNHKSGYYGTGTVVLDGVETEGAAPLGTTDLPMVWNWYADSSKQNRWDNITVTVAKDGTMSTYYDGVKVQTTKNAAYATEILGGMKKATNNILGGSYYPDPDLVAMMDNFAVYNTALSDADIKTLSAGKAADKTVVEEQPDPNNKSGEVTAISFTDYEISSNRKTLEVYFSAKPDKVTAVNNKGTKVKKITLGRTTKITFKSAMKIGSKVKVTATKDGKSVSKTYTVKGTIKISKVKAKKNTKKVTGKLNIKKATVKVKVKYKGKKKYTKYKKAKVSGKKFTFKTKKLKKGSKIVIKVTKKNYKTKTKTVKVK